MGQVAAWQDQLMGFLQHRATTINVSTFSFISTVLPVLACKLVFHVISAPKGGA